MVGTEEVFGPRCASDGCRQSCAHVVVTEASELWACDQGVQGRLGLNNEQDRLVPKRMDPQNFAHVLAPISALAAGRNHSAAVTVDCALYIWAKVMYG